MHVLPHDYHYLLKQHKTDFEPGMFENLLKAIIAADLNCADKAEDEDSLFEMILDEVLPEDADEAFEGKVMLLLDDYFEARE